MRLGRSPLLFLTLSALACGASPSTAPPATAADAVPSGHPLLVVTPTAILLDGALVGDPKPIETARRVQRIDELFARLNQTHASDASKSQQLWFDGLDGGALSAVSALMTATFAKHRNLHVRTRAGWVDGEWDDLLGSEHEPSPHRRLVVRLQGDRASLAWQSDAACDAVPPNADIALRDLDGYLATTCGDASPCVDIARISLESQLPFSTAADALTVLRGHANSTFVFSMLPFNGANTTVMLERTCGEAIRRGVYGYIRPEVIQSVVRANFGPMRACYEAGLGRKADLAGKVVTKGLIDREGHVTDTSIVETSSLQPVPGLPAGTPPSVTTLPDRAVAECVRRVFAGLVFPKPDGGTVTFLYPIVFSPSTATK
jgi:hypothetical protein